MGAIHEPSRILQTVDSRTSGTGYSALRHDSHVLAFDAELINTQGAFYTWRSRVLEEYEVMLRGDWLDWDKQFPEKFTGQTIAIVSAGKPLQFTRLEIPSTLIDDNIVVYKIDPFAHEKKVAN